MIPAIEAVSIETRRIAIGVLLFSMVEFLFAASTVAIGATERNYDSVLFLIEMLNNRRQSYLDTSVG